MVRGERSNKHGDSWFSTKSILVERELSLVGVAHLRSSNRLAYS